MRYLKHGLRLLFTAAMLAWIVTQVDLRSVGEVILRADPSWLLAGVAINLLSIVCAAWRWQMLLGGLGFHFRLRHLIRVVLSGAFFNMFLPSSVGGDVMKMVLIAPDMERREDAVSSVLMDRVVGLGVTIAVGLVAVLLLPSVWGNGPMLISLGLALLAFGLGAIMLFNERLLGLVARLAPPAIWRRVGPPVQRVQESLVLMAHRRDLLVKAAGISTLRQVAICVSIYCAGQAFGLGLGLVAYFATVPIAVAITALPLAINGLGLQDNALILLLGVFGLTSAQALSLSIFMHALRNGVGLLGGVIFALNRGKAEPPPAPEPLAAPPESPRNVELS
jgi:uncharacterized protein (TIRG00374 family)